jgi:ATP-dependent Clp protease adaptor protein ClpS
MGSSSPRPKDRVAAKERAKTKRPVLWNVILHNDDYTTMDFVVEVLIRHFQKSAAEATHVMLQVHRKGAGIAGVYPKDIAETKVEVVTREAREHEMPLKVTTEPA